MMGAGHKKCRNLPPRKMAHRTQRIQPTETNRATTRSRPEVVLPCSISSAVYAMSAMNQTGSHDTETQARMTSNRPAMSVPGKQLRIGLPPAIRDATANIYPKLAN